MKHQVMSLHFYSLFLFVGRHLGGLYAEVSLTHCWDELGWNMPAILYQRCQTLILGRELEEPFFLLNLQWEIASNPLVPTFLSPYSLWWTLSWGLFVPVEIWSQNHLGWKRLPEVTWPHLVNLTRDSNINSPRTKLFVNNSHIPHRLPLHSKSVFSFVLQWNRLLNCSFCCGVCMPVHTHVCRSLINFDSSLLSFTAHTPRDPITFSVYSNVFYEK